MPSEPAYVVAFKQFTRSGLSLEDLDPMEQEFYGQNDRACGILFASWVESILDLAIKSILRPNLPNNVARNLFDYEGALGTFSAKINFGYALPLFGIKTYHDLNLIRLIRNEFAHCQRPLRFETPVVKAVCAHLQIPESYAQIPASVFMTNETLANAAEAKKWDDPKHPKTRFVTACHSIAWNLSNFARRESRIAIPGTTLP